MSRPPVDRGRDAGPCVDPVATSNLLCTPRTNALDHRKTLARASRIDEQFFVRSRTPCVCCEHNQGIGVGERLQAQTCSQATLSRCRAGIFLRVIPESHFVVAESDGPRSWRSASNLACPVDSDDATRTPYRSSLQAVMTRWFRSLQLLSVRSLPEPSRPSDRWALSSYHCRARAPPPPHTTWLLPIRCRRIAFRRLRITIGRSA